MCVVDAYRRGERYGARASAGSNTTNLSEERNSRLGPTYTRYGDHNAVGRMQREETERIGGNPWLKKKEEDYKRMQPAPKTNTHPHVADELIKDILERKAKGMETYGTPLQPFNGRDALQDALEEALDLAAYIKQAIMERDNNNGV